MSEIEEAKRCFKSVYQIPYPDRYSIGSWWKSIQEKNFEVISKFATPEEVILYAQNGALTGFDHRQKDFSIIDHKLREISRIFPFFHLEDYPYLRESQFSDSNTIKKVKGVPYSNIFLTNVNYYLRSTSVFKKINDIKTILEIGSGYGGLARVFKLMIPGVAYILIDLPESLFYAQIFLQLNFPESKCCYVTSEKKINIKDFDFIFVPIQYYESIKGKQVDLVINTGSLQEMPDITVKFWMDFIQTIISTKYFYSFNYFLNNKQLYQETSRKESNLICPIFDPYWDVKYFQINPDIITIDASGRNWLEICIERTSIKNLEELEIEGRQLYERAKLYSRGSNDWFENIYMSIWKSLHEEYLREMENGILIFKKGGGVKNNLVSPIVCDVHDYYDVGTTSSRLIVRYFYNKMYYLINGISNEYGEEKYYKQML